MRWNGNESIHVFSEALGKKAMKSDVYIALGELEDYDADIFRQVEGIIKAKGYEGWRGRADMRSGADHGTVALPAFQAGLEFSFPGWRLPGSVFGEGIDSVVAYFSKLSEFYGFKVLAPSRELGQLAGRAMGEKEYKKAIAILEAATGAYPESISFQSQLAAAYESNDQLPKSAEVYRKVIELAKNANSPELATLEQKLASVLSRMR
jgi:tetratricopeptide (TPR) repeat protein